MEADSHSFDEMMEEMRQSNAEAVGVSPDELDEMCFSEIKSRLRENKREEFIESRVFGELRLRFRDWVYQKKGGGNSLIFGELYE